MGNIVASRPGIGRTGESYLDAASFCFVILDVALIHITVEVDYSSLAVQFVI
jgi:hypothetical protein